MKTFHHRAGFSLIEVTLALGVAGFCLLAIFGLMPVALSSNQAAIEQTAANGILSAVVSDLRATPSTVPVGLATTSKQYSIAIPAAGAAATTVSPIFFNSEKQLVPPAQARYRVTIAFTDPLPGGGVKSATCASLKVSWPAPVDPATGRPQGFVSSFVALDRN